MKKITLIIAMSVLGTFTINAINKTTFIEKVANQIIYAKVINNTASEFQYKVGTNVYTIAIGASEGFAFDENTQILKKNSDGIWVNWFVFTNFHAGKSINLTDLIGN